VSKPFECPNCKEIAMELEESTKEMFIQEWYCSECGHLDCQENPDYDPSPEDQEDVTRIGGWG
jgi:hypothetical protein